MEVPLPKTLRSLTSFRKGSRDPANVFELRQGICHTMIWPPLTSSVAPVMKDAASETRNRTALACSWGNPQRPSGNPLPISLKCLVSRAPPLVIGVSVAPGHIALTLIPYGATSRARCRLKPSNPALADV